MSQKRETLEPVEGAERSSRRRLDLKDELVLALFPTLTVLAVLVLVEVLTNQRVLFASLAASAFLIYLDPLHGMNTVRTLIISHLLALSVGLFASWILGDGYSAAGAAMVLTIFSMVLLDVVHPPAIGTSLIFAFRTGAANNVTLFALAIAVLVMLLVIERTALWLLGRFESN